MRVNLTNIRLGKTAREYPKVTFTVVLGEDGTDGTFVPKYEAEGWSLYRRKGEAGKVDDRGVPGTLIALPSVPLLYKVPGAGGLFKRAQFITTQSCEEKLLEAIHAAIISHPRVKAYMGVDRQSEVLTRREDAEDTGAFSG